MFVVDTNLLLFAVNPDAGGHDRSRELVEAWRRGRRPWFVTWGIAYEFLRVSAHRQVFPRPLRIGQAWRFVRAVLASPACHLLIETGRHGQILEELIAEHPDLAGNVIHDLHTVALMQEHGVREIRTADEDFRRFSEIRTVNPLRDDET